MKTFRQLYEEKKATESWTSKQTAAYFSELLGRSIPTIYRWLDKCPEIIIRLLNQR